MKLTVIIGNSIHAANAGGPFFYRTVVLALTPEQEKALEIDPKWEVYGQAVLELTPEVSHG